ncbi:MAG: porin family protein [Cytophagaceae bacterium]
MKKTYTFLTAIIVCLLVSYASYSQIMYGPRAGWNYSVVSGVNTNANFKSGLHLGAYARLGAKKVAFQPEVLFSMKGFTYKSAVHTESQTLNYIDIPLMLRLGGKFGFYLGAQPSILLGAKYKYTINGVEKKESNKDLYNTLDLAVLTGLEFELGNGLNFGTRMGFGLLPIFNSDLYKKVINLNFQFTLGYTLGKD